MKDLTFFGSNFWGHAIPRPENVARIGRLREPVEALLRQTARLVGLINTEADQLVEMAFELHEDIQSSDYERRLKGCLLKKSVPRKLSRAIYSRAKTIYGEIDPLFQGHTMLDVGCGNGLISDMAKDRFGPIQLLDVVDYRSASLDGMPFTKYNEGQRLPVEEAYDTVLLLTVLHHSKDPLTLLQESWRVTAKRLIIIESVFGVNGTEGAKPYALQNSKPEDQLAYAVYVDWLYNRVLHDDIPVPYNFTTPKHWKEIFATNGMSLVQSVNLGQDIEIAPELHYLFVLDK